jgi:hypothetical protein
MVILPPRQKQFSWQQIVTGDAAAAAACTMHSDPLRAAVFGKACR